jgi:gluconate 5-dehydrogenase
MNLFDLSGKTALITGSSRGIGYALAQGLLEAGARVVVHGRDGAAAEASAEGLRRAAGGEVAVSTFDVTDPDAVDNGIATIEGSWGTPDICVNNACIQRRAPFT